MDTEHRVDLGRIKTGFEKLDAIVKAVEEVDTFDGRPTDACNTFITSIGRLIVNCLINHHGGKYVSFLSTHLEKSGRSKGSFAHAKFKKQYCNGSSAVCGEL